MNAYASSSPSSRKYNRTGWCHVSLLPRQQEAGTLGFSIRLISAADGYTFAFKVPDYLNAIRQLGRYTKSFTCYRLNEPALMPVCYIVYQVETSGISDILINFFWVDISKEYLYLVQPLPCCKCNLEEFLHSFSLHVYENVLCN